MRRLLLALALLLATAATADARPIRRLFEPTDLEIETPGTAELDLQAGVIRSQGPYRTSVPDFELDLGLSRRVELDIDGALGFEGPSDGSFGFDHVSADNLWVAAKIGLLDSFDPARGVGAAFGLQVGPKLPLAIGAHGVGVEALALAVLHAGRTHLTLNFGGLLDPETADPADASVTPASSRPRGLEGGLDLDRDLDDTGRWSLTGELGGVYFFSDDPRQLAATAGVAWQPRPTIELSIVALVGFASGSDRYGLLLGVSPKLPLWR